MERNTQHSLAIVLRLAMTLTLFTTLQIASAQGPPADTSLTTDETPAADSSSAMDNAPGVRFVHVARGDNLSGNTTYIDHPLTNNNPNAIVFVTPNVNPGGVGGTYNDHPIGVWYNSSQGKWGIFNEDLANILEGAAFNVLIPEPGPNVFVHVVTETGSYVTVIDHPLTNGNPDAVLLVTQNWNPGGGTGVYYPHQAQVHYSPGSTQKWGISSNDPLPLGAAFNVLVLDAGPNAFIHTATSTNTVSSKTYIDHPLTNNNPNALLLVTYTERNLAHGLFNFEVSYDSTQGQWAILWLNWLTIYEGVSFSVVIPVTNPAYFVHEATAGNITGDYTSIDHPLTNDNPNALVFVTQNWNGGLGGGSGTHAIGVWYDDVEGKWAIFNQNQAAMPVHTAFDVLIPNVDTGVFVHRATAGNTILHLTSIDYPLTNNNPDAIVFITPNWNPGDVGGTYNDHATGVYYNSTAQKWTIFNQDLALMPIGAAFNVMVPLSDTTVFVHKATAGNTAAFVTLIDHPLTNDNPDAVVLVTQNYNPGGVGGTYNAHPIVTGYDDAARKWAILNADHAAVPVGAAFNVMVKVHEEVYLPLVMR